MGPAELCWRIRRSMGPAELCWRIRRLLWQFWARIRRKKWQQRYERLAAASSPTIIDAISRTSFYGLAEIDVNDVPKQWVDSTITAAEKLMQHRYPYLALGEIELGDQINWNYEYKRRLQTPLKFGPWMDYRDTDSYGDFKYFWELPRLQHLITLAKAYYLTGEERYAREVTSQIKGFIEQSPYLLGVNWIMPMEACIRLVSLSWIAAFLKSYIARHPKLCGLMEQMVRSHIHYATTNYAAYSSANNHLIAEAAGVFIATLCFDRLTGLEKHRQTAYRILSREALRQFYPDGVNKEQAIHYQLFASEFLLLAGILGHANGIDFPREYWDVLENNAVFLAAVADDKCSVPGIGDSDDGRAVVLSEADDNPVRSVLAASAVLFERGDLKAKAGEFDQASFWLLGKQGAKKFESLPAEPGPARKAFQQGGYYILNGSNRTRAKLIFDCGPLGLGSISAHGHADSLSFVLTAFGRSYFVDPGTYTYMAHSPYRNYFRSTAAHNTIVIDGLDQSQMAGPFLWSRKARSYLEEWASDSERDRVVACHHGYLSLADPVTHRRAVSLDKRTDVVTVHDHLEMKGTHKVEQHFHLAPECEVRKVGTALLRITNSGSTIEVQLDKRLDCRIARASENPICGWYSAAYDHKQPSNSILCSGTFSGEQHFATVIRLAV